MIHLVLPSVSATPTRGRLVRGDRAGTCPMEQGEGCRYGLGGQPDELRAELSEPVPGVEVIGLRVRPRVALAVEVPPGHPVEVGIGDQAERGLQALLERAHGV